MVMEELGLEPRLSVCEMCCHHHTLTWVAQLLRSRPSPSHLPKEHLTIHSFSTWPLGQSGPTVLHWSWKQQRVTKSSRPEGAPSLKGEAVLFLSHKVKGMGLGPPWS